MFPPEGARAARSRISRTVPLGIGVGRNARQEYRVAIASRTSMELSAADAQNNGAGEAPKGQLPLVRYCLKNRAEDRWRTLTAQRGLFFTRAPADIDAEY